MGIPYSSFGELINAFRRQLNDAIRGEFKLLLETKHLYQRVKIGADDIHSEILKNLKLSSDFSASVSSEFFRLSNSRFFLEIPPIAVKPPNEMEALQTMIGLLVPNVKVFCDGCDSREAFSPLQPPFGVTDTLRRSGQHFEKTICETSQIFLVVYQCQRCKGAPITFQVRRDKWTLILEGRSPIEHIEMPSYIPKAEQKYFRDALVAMHGGKTLAALFYLRLFLEQFARRQTGITTRETGEEIMRAYGAGLPEKIRDTMPSLREWYEKLSGAIHEAREDADLFEEARCEIERHFDMRRVHRIKDVIPANAAKSAEAISPSK
jgi:hypothetical protein